MLTREKKKQCMKLFKSTKKSFSVSKTDLVRTEVIIYRIDTGNVMPVRQQPRRMSTKQKQEVGKLVDDMLDDGVITTSKSPWFSFIVLVKKKGAVSDFVLITVLSIEVQLSLAKNRRQS